MVHHWTFFLHAWDLKGKYPAILDDPERGPVARELVEHATALLDGFESDGGLWAQGVHGIWPAVAVVDDVVVNGESRFPMLRQQAEHGDSRPNRSLADFVAPEETGLSDHIGAFAISIHGAERISATFERDGDDYHSIMVKALADRLAEAGAEWLHEQTRRAWYAPDEQLSDDELVGERFQGIRPAFGYPACPDHSEKRRLFELLDAGRQASS